MSDQSIFVRATWDDEAHVWVATIEDVPGLVAEAATMGALRDKVLVMVSELRQLNGGGSKLAACSIAVVPGFSLAPGWSTKETRRLRRPPPV